MSDSKKDNNTRSSVVESSPAPNLNLTSSAPKVPLSCPTHKKDLKYICETDNQVLCDTCRQSHKSLNHSLLFLSEAEKYIVNSAPKYINTGNELVKTLKGLNLPQSSSDMQNGLDKLEAARKKLVDLVDSHFRKLSQNFQFLYCKFPSAETRDILINRINENIAEVEAIGKKSLSRDLTAHDIAKFYERNYLKEKSEMEVQVKTLFEAAADPSRGKQTKDSLPQVCVKDETLERLMRELFDYASTIVPGDLTKDQQLGISIDQQNYYREGAVPIFGTINDTEKTLALFKTDPNILPLVKALSSSSDIPYSHSSIITPEGALFLAGGCSLSNGNITSATYKLEGDSLNLVERSPMLVKRVGHTLTLVDNEGGQIYAIGGRTDNKVRTKLCERYLIKENKWERIANLNFARSRSAVCVFNKKFIYAFFGTDSVGNTVKTIEKYDIEKNEWTLINSNNIVGGLETTFGAAVQINKNQIMLFGGFADGELFKDNVTASRRILLFNVKSETLQVVSRARLPIEFSVSNSSGPVVCSGAVYCLGHFYQKCDSELRRALDTDYLLRIDKDGCEVQTLARSSKDKVE